MPSPSSFSSTSLHPLLIFIAVVHYQPYPFPFPHSHNRNGRELQTIHPTELLIGKPKLKNFNFTGMLFCIIFSRILLILLQIGVSAAPSLGKGTFMSIGRTVSRNVTLRKIGPALALVTAANQEFDGQTIKPVQQAAARGRNKLGQLLNPNYGIDKIRVNSLNSTGIHLRKRFHPLAAGVHYYSTMTGGIKKVEFDMLGIKLKRDLVIYEKLDSDIVDLLRLFSLDENLSEKSSPILEGGIPPERIHEIQQHYQQGLPSLQTLIIRWKNPNLSESKMQELKKSAMKKLLDNRKAIGERASELLKKQKEEIQELFREGRKIKVDEYWLRPDLEMAKELDSFFPWVLAKETYPDGGMPRSEGDLNKLRTNINEQWNKLEKWQEDVGKSVLIGWKSKWEMAIIERMTELELLVVRMDIAKLAMQIRHAIAVEEAYGNTPKLGEQLLTFYEEVDDALRSHRVGKYTSKRALQICTHYFDKKMKSSNLDLLTEIQMNFIREYWKEMDEEWANKLDREGDEGIAEYAEFTGRNNPQGLLASSEQRTLREFAKFVKMNEKAKKELK